MTQILLVLYQDANYLIFYEDPRSHLQLVKDINTGAFVVGEGRDVPAGTRQWAMSQLPIDLITVVPEPPPVQLTARHYDVLFRLASFKRASVIATELNISRRTVYAYIAEMKERFQAKSREELLANAREMGMLPWEDYDTRRFFKDIYTFGG